MFTALLKVSPRTELAKGSKPTPFTSSELWHSLIEFRILLEHSLAKLTNNKKKDCDNLFYPYENKSGLLSSTKQTQITANIEKKRVEIIDAYTKSTELQKTIIEKRLCHILFEARFKSLPLEDITAADASLKQELGEELKGHYKEVISNQIEIIIHLQDQYNNTNDQQRKNQLLGIMEAYYFQKSTTQEKLDNILKQLVVINSPSVITYGKTKQ